MINEMQTKKIEMRFIIIRYDIFNYPDESSTQTNTTYWDTKVNSSFSLDDSYVSQNDSFHHPYTGEEIFFDDYPNEF